MTYRTQIERNYRRELERWREQLGSEMADELTTLERNAGAFIEHECNMLDELVERFVHVDERAGVRDRAAQSWPWSPPHDDLSQTFWRVHHRVRTGVTLASAPPRVYLGPDINHGFLMRWVTEGLAAASAGPTARVLIALGGNNVVIPPGPEMTVDQRARMHGAIDNVAGMACVYAALSETIRHECRFWDLLETAARGDAHRHLIETIAPTAITETGNLAEAARDEARGRLAEALRQHLKRFRQAVLSLSGTPPISAAAADDCARKLDLAFADYVERLGESGKDYASTVRRASDDRLKNKGPRWTLWCSHARGERFLRGLARVVWIEDVKPFIKRNTPALVYPVHEDVVRIHSRTYSLVDKGGQRSLVFDDGAPIAIAPAMPTLAEDDMSRMVQLITAGVRLLGSVAAHRVLRWEVASGCERVIRGEPDARALIVDGGWTALAEQLELGKKREHIVNLRAIVHAQSAVTITLPDGSRGNMLALRDKPPVGQRRGSVEIVLGTMLLPHYIYELAGKGRELRESKRLVPIVELPPFVGRNNDHGAQATASMIVVRELRVRAAELYRDGAVLIPLERWIHLFHEARLPSSLIGKVLDRWTHDGSDGPAFLMSPERDHYTLGDAHSRARDFLRDVGKLELDRSKAGKLSVEKRRKRLSFPRAVE